MNADKHCIVAPYARPLFMIADTNPKLVSFANIDRYLRVDINSAREDIDGGKTVFEVRVHRIDFKDVSGAAVPDKGVFAKRRHTDSARLKGIR